VQDGFNTICNLLMKPKCAGAVHRWGLLPCFQNMCYRGKPPSFHCAPQVEPDKCGGAGRNEVYLYPNAFNPKGCGDNNSKLPGTMAHEMSHICISGRGEGPGPDCDIRKRTQFGTPYCTEQQISITNKRTKDIEENCGGM
jgi:hypothetical protein